LRARRVGQASITNSNAMTIIIQGLTYLAKEWGLDITLILGTSFVAFAPEAGVDALGSLADAVKEFPLWERRLAFWLTVGSLIAVKFGWQPLKGLHIRNLFRINSAKKEAESEIEKDNS